MNTIKADSNTMSLAALVFGILSLLGSLVIVPTPLFAGLAITFSWLSRGDRRMSNQALAGNILAVFAIGISLIVLTIIVFALAMTGRQGFHFFAQFPDMIM